LLAAAADTAGIQDPTRELSFGHNCDPGAFVQF